MPLERFPQLAKEGAMVIKIRLALVPQYYFLEN
jgi:hypothetical protein